MNKKLKDMAEKSLKSFLKKKKIGYTTALLTAYLITGGIGLALSEDFKLQSVQTQESLLLSIKAQKSEIVDMLLENEERLKQLKMDRLSLINEADWYSKSWYPSYFTSFNGSYTKADNRKKQWIISNKEDTTNDKSRREYSGYSKQDYKGTGWIMNTDSWNSYTHVYDNTARLTIIPSLSPPQVTTPTAPNVNFTTPQAPTKIIPPTVTAPLSIPMSFTVSPVTVVNPTVTTPMINPMNINIKDETVSLNIAEINVSNPGTLNLPNINFTTPTLAMSPAMAPTVREPSPELPTAPTVHAPTWMPFSAPNMRWLGRGSYYKNWLNTDFLWTSLHNNFDNTPTRNYGTTGVGNDISNVHSNAWMPLFNMVNATGGTFAAINTDIRNTGQVVTLYDDVTGTTLTTASGSVLSGWNGVTGKLQDRYGASYSSYTDPINASHYVGGVTPTADELAANGQTFNINNNRAVSQIHRTIFVTGSTSSGATFNNITAHFGGNVTLMNNNYTSGKISVQNSNLNLYGTSTITTGLNATAVADYDFTGTFINVYGNSNTFFNIQSSTGAHAHYDMNQSGQFSFTMDNDIEITKSQTVILKLDNAHDDPGRNSAMSNGTTGRNWNKQYVYLPYLGAVDYENTGTVSMYGAQNAGIRVNAAILGNKNANASYNPINGITSNIAFGGDQNVGLYFGNSDVSPTSNGIFNGKLNLTFEFGESLQPSGTQIQTSDGNISGGDANRAESSVGIIIDSGQRSELNVKALYPATERYMEYRNFTGQTSPLLGTTWMGDNAGGFTVQNPVGQLYIFDSSGNVLPDVLINSVKLDNFKVTFGKYSKDNLAVVARNGSSIEWDNNVTDNSPIVTGVDESSTAIGSTLAYAEGIWFNPRQRGLQNAAYVWRPGTSAAIAYGTLTQQGGKYYVPNYRSTVNISNNAIVNSIKSVPFYAKDGGLITTRSVTLNGFGSTAAIAYADKNYADTKNGVEITRDKEGNMIYDGNSDHSGTGNTNAGGVKWSSTDTYYGPTIVDATGNTVLYNGMGRTDKLPITEVLINGDINANVQGPRRDSAGIIISGSDRVNDNIGAVAWVKNGLNGAEVSVSGNVNINGLAAIADGTDAYVDIQGMSSNIKTGSNGALAAMNGGQIRFSGGTIEHKDTYAGSHDGILPFYADNNGSQINFAGPTIIDIHDGIVFYGNTGDYAAGASLTAKYINTSNITINLKDDGVNLGLFHNYNSPTGIIWNGSSGFLSSLASTYGGITFNDNGYMYTAAFENTPLTVAVDVDRDSSTNPFNELIFERSKVTINSGVKIYSTTEGNTMAITSNNVATTNAESGYDIKGELEINTNSGTTVGAFVNFGHIKLDIMGKITVNNGVGAYGVNGSYIENKGNINVTGTGQGIVGIARKVDSAGNVETIPDTFGTDNGLSGLLVEINNQGTITTGDNSVGIYADNNINGATVTEVIITSTKEITVGDNSVGIMVKGASDGGTNPLLNGAGGTVNLTTTGLSTPDIKIGKNSSGIYGENSIFNMGSSYRINVEDGSIAMLLLGSSTASLGTLHFDYSGGVTGSAVGLVYEGTGGSLLSNSTNINVNDLTGTTGEVVGLYAKSSDPLVLTDELTNSGNINLSTDSTYGIVSEDVKIINTGTIITGIAGSNGGKGIFVKDAALDTDGGLIQINGNNAIGIYAKSTSTNNREIKIGTGSGAMNINGEKSVGIFVEDTSDIYTIKNDANITLSDTSALIDRKIGMTLIGTTNANNYTLGTITVGANNIGIYAENATLDQQGIVNVTHLGAGTQNIGIHALGNGGSFSISNSGTINVNGISNIGISLLTKTGGTGTLDITGGNITITATSMADNDTPVGVYGKGNGITVLSNTTSLTTVGANGIGVYLDGNNTTTMGGRTFNLSSDVSGKLGIGAYFKGGAETTGTQINVNSTLSAVHSVTGEIVRPIGVYYSTGSTSNSSPIEIMVTSKEAIGMYVSTNSTFTNNGSLTIMSNKSVGGYFSDSNVTNNANVTINSNDSYGLFFNGGNSLLSPSTTVTIGGANSLGIISKGDGTTLENNGTIVNNTSTGVSVVAVDGGYIKNNNIIQMSQNGIGAVAIGKDSMTNKGSILELSSGSSLIETLSTLGTWSIGALAGSGGKIILNGGNIVYGDTAIGIMLDQGFGELKSGSITVGIDGIGIYAKNSSLDLTSYTGNITVGDSGIGIYSMDSILGTNGAFDIYYSHATNKGVGIYYNTSTPGTTVNNGLSVNHVGNNLVNILAKDIDLINTGSQMIGPDSIGIYGDNSTISNSGILTLNGNNAVGIYLGNGSLLSNIGVIQGGASITPMLGIYVDNGDIVGSNNYDFDVSGGVGVYLKNTVMSYNGTINVKGDSVSSNDRSIGIYAGSQVLGGLNTNVNVTGSDAIGLYLEDSGVSAANIIYNGDITITSSSTGSKGIGAYLSDNTSLTLGSSGSMTIAGTNNIGFYVNNGATLNISGGTITNTPDGIFAYINNGILNFTAGTVPNINYVNVIVSGISGTLINDTTITVGTSGLQGAGGAIVTNTANGKILSTDKNGMGITGITGANISNDGQIKLTGDKSVGIYTASGATAISTGHVEVGDKGVGYYASSGGLITVNGTTSIGEESAMMYSTGGTIHYIGGNVIGSKNSVITTVTDIGGLIDLNGKNITVGNKGTGVFIDGTATMSNVQNIGKISVGKEAVGIYLATNSSGTITETIDFVETDAIGILDTGNSDIVYNGNLTAMTTDAKGIVSSGTGSVINQRNIILTGDSSIGIYGENSTLLENFGSGIIEIGNGTLVSSSVGLYGRQVSQINNKGTIKISENSVGIYGENSNVNNIGIIQNTIGNNTGIYGKNSNVTNSGSINLSDGSNGIYVDNGIISNMGNINTGNNKSVGLYGSGISTITHNSGVVKVGNNSVGVAIDDGYITVANGAKIVAGTESTSIYSIKGTAKSYENMILDDYAVGMYTKSGLMENHADITLGISSISSGNERISVGMATEQGTIENYGTLNMPYSNGVGMLANNGGTARNHGIININGSEGYGMQAVNNSTSINYGTIDVIGNKGRGMVALNNSTAENYGTIRVTGSNAEGIYVETGGKAANYGTIIVDGTSRTGITIGVGGILINTGTINIANGATAHKNETSSTITQVGDITIDGPNISIDGSTIDNIGSIVINGVLDFNTVKLSGNGLNDHVGTINAETFKKGEFIILSDVTQGSNKGAYTIQYLKGTANIPNSGDISAISQSVSYVVDLQKDPTDSNKITIMLVKIPYEKMVSKTKAIEFGKGLDELYSEAIGTELKMFDALDTISEDDELAETFENEIRGNEYANIQDRMLDINSEFDISYENLKHSRLYSKDSLKIGLITAKGESKYKNPAIINYDQTSLGLMMMKEYETRTFGQKYGWHIGFAQNKFEFDTDSKETVYSLNLGISYERNLLNDRLKWHSRGEVIINHHQMDRKIDISGTRYENDSKYWSGMAMLKNKIRYEHVDENGRMRAGIQGMLDLGYGKYFNIKENGDGMFLELPSTDMYTIRPGIGADIAFTARTKKGNRISLIGKASIEYELGKIYDGPNRVKFKGTESGYYDLEKPKKERTIGKIGAELKYETRTGNSVGFEVTRQEGRRDHTRYGVNFTMRLDN
ncbi:autotransporter-associated N-terminal domain-containing protein [Fusobacterium sp. PH5-44]|uniref:autotransporter-associated N-terminal domain-containing protein n=1 Tax=unclassified Fusobacterium TaxID=2648384 RepID=UPI003D25BE19